MFKDNAFDKRTIIGFCTAIAVMVIAVYFCVINTTFLDNHLLLENRCPFYVFDLNIDVGDDVGYDKRLLSLTSQDLLKENILNDYELNSGESNGITIKNNGSSIMLDGKADITTYPSATKNYITLDNGSYFISSGGGHVQSYFEGWKDGSNTILTKVRNCNFFEADNDLFENYRYTIYLPEGSEISNEVIRPVITRIGDKDESPDTAKYHIWSITKDSWNNLSNKEKALFERSTGYLYKDCTWVSVQFEDSTGIQYKDGKKQEGKMDYCGRIWE